MWVGEGVVGRGWKEVGGVSIERASPTTLPPTINICCCAVLCIHVAKPADHPTSASRLHYCSLPTNSRDYIGYIHTDDTLAQ